LFILRSFTRGVKALEKLSIRWNLGSIDEKTTIKRYCHNCGKVTIYQDSMIRRHNANGKKIHQFAIYKCDEGHTWNQKLSAFKAHTYGGDSISIKKGKTVEETATSHIPLVPISLAKLRDQGIEEFEIELEAVQGKWRLDKLLSQQLIGISRTEIVKMIKQGSIMLGGVKVKSGELVHGGQTIWVNMHI
jgi:hypothetical protein